MDNIKESLIGTTQPVPLKSMGVGKLADPSIIFLRRFRWTLSSDTLDRHVIKNLQFNFKSQTIEFEAYEFVENGKINIHDWLDSELWKETLQFTTYDGCGIPIYTYDISEIEVLSDTTIFDYSVSNEVTRNLVIKYGQLNKTFNLKKSETKSDTLYLKRYNWTMSVNGGEAKSIKVSTRPTLEVEDTEINYLNSKMWIPGKSAWQSISVELNDQSRCLLQYLMGKESLVSLNLLDNCGKLLETWKLNNVQVSSMLQDDEKVNLTLKYDAVEYESACSPSVKPVMPYTDTKVSNV
jgi:hypothetical protein